MIYQLHVSKPITILPESISIRNLPYFTLFSLQTITEIGSKSPTELISTISIQALHFIDKVCEIPGD